MLYTLDTTILGPVDVTANQIVLMVLNAPRQTNWPVRTRYTDDDVREYARAGIHWTGVFGFRTAGMVGQSMKETNHLRFTGDARFGDHNFAGIGVTGGGVTGEQFDSIDEGWLAFCCHMALYVWGEPEHWPAHLQQYAPFAVRLASVRWAHRNTKLPNGQLLGFLGVVVVWRDFVNGRWAHTQAIPVGTLDNGYASGSVAKANVVLSLPRGEEPPVPSTNPKIALSAGHHNTSGGDAHETVQTGQLTPVLAATLRARGMDVRVITPDDGRGMHGGTLSDVARQVVTWANAGWVADVFLEVHTEGNGAGDKGRGAFAIYPDWGDDVDTGTRDALGPEIVRRLQAATGMPPRNNGLMSEKQTGVGIDGHRLGVFGATAAVRATTTRLIVEYGSHSSPADLALWAKPDFLQRAADATADAIAFYLGYQQDVPAPVPVDPTTLPAVRDPWREYAGGNPYSRDFWIPQPFVDWINEHGGFWSVGFAYTGAFIPEDTGILTQFFEGAALEFHPGNVGTKYEVMRRHIGVELLKEKYPAHAPKAA